MEKISEQIVAALPVPEKGNKLHYFSHARLQRQTCPVGFAVRVTASGSRSFVYFHRTNGRAHVETIGRHTANFSVLDAIIKAQEREEEIRNGGDPLPARTKTIEEKAKPEELTVSGLIDKYVARYVKRDANLRTAKVIEQMLDRLVKPRIGKVSIYALKRSDVSRMLDEIADENGPVMSDRVLAHFRKGLNWYEVHGHDDNFRSPIVNGMARTKGNPRERILTDDELRALWKATDTQDPYDLLLRFILLTATRRNEAAGMTYSEVKDGLWIIPPHRYKTAKETALPLSQAAQDILAAIPRTKGVDYVFTTGQRPIVDFSRAKLRIDARVGFTGWTIHDLRRTARSLMSRAGVPFDHAERCLGHSMGGIRSVYDKHEYETEKKTAFEALSAMVANIVLREVQ